MLAGEGGDDYSAVSVGRFRQAEGNRTAWGRNTGAENRWPARAVGVGAGCRGGRG